MDATTRTNFDTIYSVDRALQSKAFFDLMAATDQRVDWSYDVWDTLLADLKHKDNHVRAIAAQILSNLAKSDPEKRMLNDFAALLVVTKDERFVTARHCLQSLWKIGVVGSEQRQTLLKGLISRFEECISEKNCTLIRYDILQSLRNVYDATQDENIRVSARALIETEADAKYAKKYRLLWRFK